MHGAGAKWVRKQEARGASKPESALLSPRDIAGRLGLVAAVFAVLTGLAFLLSLFAPESLGWHEPAHRLFLVRATHLLLTALSVGVFVLSRSELDPQRLLSLGLIYQVLGALVISVPGYYCDMMLQARMDRLTWLAPWIIVFPILVPLRPRRCAVVAIVCATLAPLVFACWLVAESQSPPELSMWLTTFTPNYICAGLAVASGALVHSLKKEAVEARRRIMELGSYELIRRLGEGGMGEVWEARHRMLASPAAVKLIQADLLRTPGDHETFLTRFEREARITASLASPHTIRLYDFGLTEDGIVYYAMELLRGLDMRDLVERYGPVPPGRAVHFLAQVCCSLSEAHQAGLVHRDIKPANLYVCQLGDQYDFVKVMDFGLVRRIRSAATDPQLTQAGDAVGTPAFMAPEQAEGLTDVDHRADVYALGCVAYWLLSGRLVFEHESSLHMMVDHVQRRPRPLSAVSAQRIPPELEALIMNCLEKRPDARPSSAAELGHRLDRCKQQFPWRQSDARDWWERHRPRGARRRRRGG